MRVREERVDSEIKVRPLMSLGGGDSRFFGIVSRKTVFSLAQVCARKNLISTQERKPSFFAIKFSCIDRGDEIKDQRDYLCIFAI